MQFINLKYHYIYLKKKDNSTKTVSFEAASPHLRIAVFRQMTKNENNLDFFTWTISQLVRVDRLDENLSKLVIKESLLLK